MATYFDPQQASLTQQPQGGASRSYYDMMLALSDLGSKERLLKDQAAMAEEMRTTPMPGMRQNSRIMVAAHPLEFLNSGVRQGLGAYQKSQTGQAQVELANEIRRRIQEERAKQGAAAPGAPGAAPQRGMVIPMDQEA